MKVLISVAIVFSLLGCDSGSTLVERVCQNIEDQDCSRDDTYKECIEDKEQLYKDYPMCKSLIEDAHDCWANCNLSCSEYGYSVCYECSTINGYAQDCVWNNK